LRVLRYCFSSEARQCISVSSALTDCLQKDF
jgi:hypothetical protein